MTRTVLTALCVVAAAIACAQIANAQQVIPTETAEHTLTYSRGEAVLPIYHGWHPNADGTIDLWFGYLNQNWREETDVPIGPDNSISPEKYGPDAGQPTHFLPRNNRFIFKVTVPKEFPEKEVVWTLTSHGITHRAYATLHPGYVKDNMGMQREYFGASPAEGNTAPEIRVEGEQARTIKVGEESLLTVIAKDDGIPRPGFRGDGADAALPRRPGQVDVPTNEQLRAFRPSICGDNRTPFFCGEPNEGAGNLFSVKGLRMQCFLYRGDPNVPGEGDFGDAAYLKFDPPQAKAWEDHRNGSPWATGYVLPPLPPDNTWKIKTSFSRAGAYVVRCQAHDGLLVTNTNVTFTVTP